MLFDNNVHIPFRISCSFLFGFLFLKFENNKRTRIDNIQYFNNWMILPYCYLLQTVHFLAL